MNTDQIEYALHARCRGQFLGVFPRNRLPKYLPHRRPLLIVANTGKASSAGIHWVALYIDHKGEYFDSLGQPPQDNIFVRYLDHFCTSWTYNNQQLQSMISYWCGQYVVLYGLYRCQGYSMRDIVRMFAKNDTHYNDVLVHAMFHAFN